MRNLALAALLTAAGCGGPTTPQLTPPPPPPEPVGAIALDQTEYHFQGGNAPGYSRFFPITVSLSGFGGKDIVL